LEKVKIIFILLTYQSRRHVRQSPFLEDESVSQTTRPLKHSFYAKVEDGLTTLHKTKPYFYNNIGISMNPNEYFVGFV